MPIKNLQIRKAKISIESTPQILKEISSTVFTSILTSSNRKYDTHYRIIFEDDRYKLFRKKRLTHRNKKLENIIYSLEWQVVRDIIQNNRDLLQFHAAVLSYKGEGWMFIGAPGSGKTSISIALVKYGLDFLSDEFALLNPITFELIPCPRNLIIKNHLDNYLDFPKHYKPIMIDNYEGQKSQAYFLPPSLFGSVIPDHSVRLKKIIVLKNSKKRSPKIAEIKQNEAFNILMVNLFNKHNFKLILPDVLISIIKKIPAYHLEVSNPLKLENTAQLHLLSQLKKL